ncbi:MAG: carbon-nitrogen hydrolase family protein [Marmoricola sp.]
MSPLRLALSQFGAELGDVAANLAHMRGALTAAADADADMVCFPELSLSGYLLRATDYTDALLDDVEGAERVLAADSRRLDVSVVYGAPLRAQPRGLRNAVILQEPDGRRLVYHKTHLAAKERDVFGPGTEFAVNDHGIGLACCYDLAFPEALRVVTLRGASLLLVPMAWEVPRAFVMRPLMTARAIENVAYVAGINQCGTIGDLSFSGGSCVVDPLGETIVALGGEAGLAIAELDAEWAGRLRDQRDPRAYPLLADRRPDLYAAITENPRRARLN